MNVTLPTSEELLTRFTYYDYSVFICMLVVSGAIGLFCAFYGGAQNTIRQLLTGSKALPVWPVGTSLVASFISAAYILGNTAEVYQHGTMYFMVILSYCITIPVTAYLYLPIYYNLDLITAYEYLELRFNRPVRMVAVVIYTIQMTIYVAIALYAPAVALSQVTGMTLWSAVAAIGLVCTVYTSIGGIKAVVYTDTFQAVVMFIAMTVVIAFGFNEMGGFSKVWKIAQEGKRIEFNNFRLDPTERHTIWGLIIGAYFTAAASYSTNQMLVLRYFTVDSLAKAQWVVWMNLPYLFLILILSCLGGLLAHARYATCDPVHTRHIETADHMLPYFVMDTLGHIRGVPGTFVAGIFAASLSSISSAVNSLASVFYIDIVAVLKPGISDKNGARIINVLGAFFGLLTIALVAVAQQMGNVLQATFSINSGLGGPLLGLYTLGIFLPHANGKGAMAGLLVSVAIALWLNLGPIIQETPIDFAPVSAEGCKDLYMNATNATEYHPISTEPRGWKAGDVAVYELSYMWNTLIAFLIVFIVAVPVSFFTGFNKPEKMNPKLICPVIDKLFWYLPESVKKAIRIDVGRDYVETGNDKCPSQDNPKIENGVNDKVKVASVSFIQTATDKAFPTPPSLIRSF
ncbi:putative sodium-dependent multivitamin transporter [Ornithodoros turicata]|uniref:putative sodium-dependent multivitamin transporter n=1 Tax=Ornithodoros turicata TaxID=34597 RepID=UPI00313A11A2